MVVEDTSSPAFLRRSASEMNWLTRTLIVVAMMNRGVFPLSWKSRRFELNGMVTSRLVASATDASRGVSTSNLTARSRPSRALAGCHWKPTVRPIESPTAPFSMTSSFSESVSGMRNRVYRAPEPSTSRRYTPLLSLSEGMSVRTTAVSASVSGTT